MNGQQCDGAVLSVMRLGGLADPFQRQGGGHVTLRAIEATARENQGKLDVRFMPSTQLRGYSNTVKAAGPVPFEKSKTFA